jgi:hypothetical protein
MPLPKGYFKDAPNVVADTCFLKHLCMPVKPGLLQGGEKNVAYLDVVVEAARQGYINLLLPSIVVYEATGYDPNERRQIDEIFMKPEKPLLYHSGNLVRGLASAVHGGGANSPPNIAVVKTEDGAEYLREMARLRTHARRTHNYAEVDALRAEQGDDFADGITRQIVLARCRPSGSLLVTEDHRSRDFMFATNVEGERVAATNVMGLFDALQRGGALPRIGFLEGTTAKQIHNDLRDVVTALNNKFSPIPQLLAPMHSFEQAVQGSSVDSGYQVLAEWLPKRAALLVPEITQTLGDEKPWRHRGSLIAVEPAAEEKPRKPGSAHQKPRELRGGLGGGDLFPAPDHKDGWER